LQYDLESVATEVRVVVLVPLVQSSLELLRVDVEVEEPPAGARTYDQCLALIPELL
jgi:hypothetical protein